mgnify:CR=1 FL=1
MVAIMNEALELQAGQKVLEVGAGSGWHAATVAEVVAPSDAPRETWGHVWTIEIVPELARMAMENIRANGFADRITVLHGDGSMGYPPEAPYDRILVTAAAPAIPDPLVEQLATGGVMVIPVGGLRFFQSLIRVRKGPEGVITENLGSVAFVPLIGKYGHQVR